MAAHRGSTGRGNGMNTKIGAALLGVALAAGAYIAPAAASASQPSAHYADYRLRVSWGHVVTWCHAHGCERLPAHSGLRGPDGLDIGRRPALVKWGDTTRVYVKFPHYVAVYVS